MIAPASSSRTSGLDGCAMLPSLVPQVKPRRPIKPATANRWEMFNAFVDLTMRYLSPAAVKVWLVLYRDTKPGGTAKVGQTDIARRAGVSDRAVRDALRQLEILGLVLVIKRGQLRTGPSTYRVQATSSQVLGLAKRPRRRRSRKSVPSPGSEPGAIKAPVQKTASDVTVAYDPAISACAA